MTDRARKDAIASVRFDPAVLDAVKDVASAAGQTAGAWIRNAVEREVKRRENGSAAPAPRAQVMEMPALSLNITADDRWQALVSDCRRKHSTRSCCGEGHAAPEEASAHGAVLAAQLLSAWARMLQPPAFGAVLLQAQGAA